jgi:hypothetical protein
MAAKHVKPGDDLTIDANVYNAAVDAYLLKNGQQPRGLFKPEQQQQTRIVVRNDSGSDLLPYEPVGFGDPIISPDDNLEGFQDRIILSVGGPSSSRPYQWGLTQEAIPAGDFGEVAVSGLSYAQVDVKDGMQKQFINFLTPFGSSTSTSLIPVTCGFCRVIWLYNPDGTGLYHGDQTIWAIVNLG